MLRARGAVQDGSLLPSVVCIPGGGGVGGCLREVRAAAGCLDKSSFPWQPAPSDGKGNVLGPVMKWHLGMSWASDEDDGQRRGRSD